MEAIDLHVSDICSELGIMRVDLKDWENALFQEIKRLLEHAGDKESARPTKGNVDFVAVRKAFRRVQRYVVITRVFSCVMWKACYKRVAMAELNGPAYERVEGESLEVIMKDITERQQKKYLKLEYLPIPRVNVKIPNSNELSLESTKKQPVRYLMPKLHKQLPAFRGITVRCGTTTEGIAKRVHAVLVGIRTVLNALWREDCILSLIHI